MMRSKEEVIRIQEFMKRRTEEMLQWPKKKLRSFLLNTGSIDPHNLKDEDHIKRGED